VLSTRITVGEITQGLFFALEGVLTEEIKDDWLSELRVHVRLGLTMFRFVTALVTSLPAKGQHSVPARWSADWRAP
jgi:hypothetical protein